MLRELGRKALDARLGERVRLLLETDLVWLFVIGGGVVLRLRQFTARLSFGNDEAALARNIVERSFAGLTQPLDYRQGAPVLFLLVQKAFYRLFGAQDFVLELFPLLSGCIALYLLYRIARRHFGWAGLFAVLAFALSLWLISYSADPKQYSSDTLAALLLLDLADRCLAQTARSRDFLLLGVVGVLAIWLSHPAAFILPGIGLVLLVTKRSGEQRVPLAWLLGLDAAWAVTFGADYVVSLRHLAVDAYLQKYWSAYFMPLPPWSHPAWFLDAYRSLLLPSANRTDLFVLLTWSLFIVIGGTSLLAGSRPLAATILLPFALVLVASAFHKYPIWDRLLLFLVPLVYLLMAQGLRRVYLWASRWNRALAVGASAAIFLILLWPMTVAAKRNSLTRLVRGICGRWWTTCPVTGPPRMLSSSPAAARPSPTMPGHTACARRRWKSRTATASCTSTSTGASWKTFAGALGSGSYSRTSRSRASSTSAMPSISTGSARYAIPSRPALPAPTCGSPIRDHDGEPLVKDGMGTDHG